MSPPKKVEVREVAYRGCGSKVRWVKKYATLLQDEKILILADKKTLDDVTFNVATESSSHLRAAVRSIALHTDVLCIPLDSATHKKDKRRYLIRIMSDKETQPELESEVTLSVKSEEDQEDLVKEINDVINGETEPSNDETIKLEDLDAIKVETDALNHLNKTRPKFQGRRKPQKRPRKVLEDIDENAEKKQKTEENLESPVKSACTDGTEGASSSGLGIDSDAEVTSKDPSTSCSNDNLKESDNCQGRKFKRKSKKSSTNQSPSHGEVRRRPKTDRATSLLKRLSNRLSQVFGHSPSGDADRDGENEASPSSPVRKKSEDSLDAIVAVADAKESGSDNIDENLSQISNQAEQLLSITKTLQEDLRNGAKTSDLVQSNLNYIRLAMRHLTRSLEHMSLVDTTTKTTEALQEE